MDKEKTAMAPPSPSSPDFTNKKDMMFTRNNVQRAVRNVRETDLLGAGLGVPRGDRGKLRVSSEEMRDDEVEEYVTYFMDHDPLASWRRVIVVLDMMKGMERKRVQIRYDIWQSLSQVRTGVARDCVCVDCCFKS
ncbi:hypothetical protein GBAR_LOCUS3911 [Geodia barretti]|uniref:Uncharacterized protein n=1 Tax=Geodia barretti TaxID=519541 RepID=A0AA35W2A2_GEOBA|nr:hypothetical protein GBAR_LOCUS3911 [Geodia barretti]